MFDATIIKTRACTDDEYGPFTIKYGTSKLGEQTAYVTVTVDAKDFGGCMHDLVLKHAPDLRPLVELHLTSVEGVPMHYVANAKYWWELATHTSCWSAKEKRTVAECAEIFREHVLHGLLHGDGKMPQPESMVGWEKAGIESFLRDRLPALRDHVQAVLGQFLGND